MFRFSPRLGAGLSALALALSSHAVSAGVVQIRDAGGAPDSQILDGTASGINVTTTGGPFKEYFVGVIDAEINTGSGWSPFLTYCIEPDAGIAFGPQPGDMVGASFTTDALTNAGFTAQTAAYAEILWSNAFASTLSNPFNAAAFQALLWEFSIDGSSNLTDGNFKMDNTGYTGDVLAIAQDWLGKITGGDWTSSTSLIAYMHPTGQNMIGPLDPTQNVPEASSLAMLALVTTGGVWYGKRRSRQALMNV
jgi:hypothetical protein